MGLGLWVLGSRIQKVSFQSLCGVLGFGVLGFGIWVQVPAFWNSGLGSSAWCVSRNESGTFFFPVLGGPCTQRYVAYKGNPSFWILASHFYNAT